MQIAIVSAVQDFEAEFTASQIPSLTGRAKRLLSHGVASSAGASHEPRTPFVFQAIRTSQFADRKLLKIAVDLVFELVSHAGNKFVISKALKLESQLAEPEHNHIPFEPSQFLGLDVPQDCVQGIVENLKMLQTHAGILDRYMEECTMDEEALEDSE